VESAKAAIQLLNHRTKVTCLNQKVPESLENAWAENIHKADVVVDCTDNFGVRFALNRLCVSQRKPLVSGAVTQLEAQLTVFDTRSPESPCYRCLYEPNNAQNPSCAESGVLSPLVGIIGSFQALEVIRLLVPFGQPLCGRLILFDAKDCRWRELHLESDPLCPVCSATA
jgi:adenylyltransferase/sulfurtransferase